MSAGTREKLLLTAMHLYGEQGIHAVSLRTISAAAGSKNSAAMHYHFNNKLGVIDALVEFLAGHIYAIAIEQEFDKRIEVSTSLRESVRLSLRPLAELQRRYDWGSAGIRFLSHLLIETEAELDEITRRHFSAFYLQADTYLANHLPALDGETRRLRMLFATITIFHGFAARASLRHSTFGRLNETADDVLLNQLVDYLAGGLQA